MNEKEEIFAPGSLLKAKDIMRILNVSKTTAYRLMREEIPCLHFGPGIVRVRVKDLEKYINSHLDEHNNQE